MGKMLKNNYDRKFVNKAPLYTGRVGKNDTCWMKQT